MNIWIILLLIILFCGVGTGGYYGAFNAPWTSTAPNHFVGGGLSLGGIVIFLIILRVLGII